MTKVCLSTLALIVATFLGRSLRADDPTPLKTFMRAKLDHSKNLLQAITTEDFDAMGKESQKIILLTLAEQWQVLETPEYAQHSLEFRRTAGAIRDAAEKKNLDGAALAYVDLTMKCVNCHKYIKKQRMAGGDFRSLDQFDIRP
jgi:hypothetical protein